MKPMFVAEAIGRKPDSSEFRLLLSSSFKYGLTKGSYVSEYIEITPLAISIIKPVDPRQKIVGLREAAQKPDIFRKVYDYYRNGKFPATDEFFKNKLEVEFGVPREFANECVQLLYENGKFVGIIRDVMGSPRVVFDESQPLQESQAPTTEALSVETPAPTPTPTPTTPKTLETAAKQIFIGHGKNTIPLEQLKNILDEFKVPYKVAADEPHRGRPISAKVKETMQNCSSAIFIFTADEETQDSQGNKIWKPSDNVVYELGAATYLYENKIVILKEEGVTLASDFSDFGYITFQKNNIEAKAMALIKELVGLEFVKLTPT
jgi:predicted nucleotide-binding protein